MQSAYRTQHSTETALVRVQEDILSAVDNGKAVAQVLLVLSAAFDTLDHDIMIQRLQDYHGVSGAALAWIKSYLPCGCLLNEAKAELPITLGHVGQISLSGHTIPVSATAQNLGVTNDQDLSFEAHQTTLRGLRISTYAHWVAWKHFSPQIQQAVIMSRLDYCNSLLQEIHRSLLRKLQRVQNSAACLITRSPRHEHITPVLESPLAPSQCQDQVQNTPSGIQTHQQPWSGLPKQHLGARVLRYGDQNLLAMPKPKLASYGYRSPPYDS